jgi:hypothetical protein
MELVENQARTVKKIFSDVRIQEETSSNFLRHFTINIVCLVPVTIAIAAKNTQLFFPLSNLLNGEPEEGHPFCHHESINR